MKKIGLLPRLILGIFAGILIGKLGFIPLVRLLATFNSLFGNFLGFIIPLMIIGFVAPGIAELGKKANNLLLSTAALAYASTVFAGLMAYFSGKALLPIVVKNFQMTNNEAVSIAPYFSIEIPQVMGIMSALVLAFILGLGIANTVGEEKTLFNVLKDFQKIIEKVIAFVLIPLIPVHISGIFARITSEGNLASTIKSFSGIFFMILILQVVYILIQYAIACGYSKKPYFASIKNLLPAYFTAIGTQSSAATIPVSLECSRANKVEEDIVDFVVPLCATIHLAGDTITLVLGSMGLLMATGVNPDFAMMFPYILMLGVTMIAAPGIPGGGVMAALGLLENMLSLGQSQLALMIALHFSQDSFGTATNVTGDGALAIIINEKVRRSSKSNSK
jgi:Na+/H+-dicarboxylate symporter